MLLSICKFLRLIYHRTEIGWGREGGESVEITIKGEAKEIAALVLAVQERHSEPTQVKIELDHKRVAQSVFEATRDTNEA